MPVQLSTARQAIYALCALQLSTNLHAALSNTEAPIVVGHYHLNVTDVDEHIRFWAGTLGGTAITLGPDAIPAIEFPDIFLILHEQPPSGPTRGTAFDHIGFAVPDVPAMTENIVAAGYSVTVGREPPPGETASPPTAGNYGRFSYITGPDGVKIELVTDESEGAPPIVHHHVHFVHQDFVTMQQWYMRAFNATLREGQTDFFIGADLPGVGYMLNFFSWLPNESLIGTAGRAVDHIGFEVRDLEAFSRALEEKGIALTEPYHRDDALGVMTATITDPYGTVLELTEGLR